jgi:hypothetical protein
MHGQRAMAVAGLVIVWRCVGLAVLAMTAVFALFF